MLWLSSLKLVDLGMSGREKGVPEYFYSVHRYVGVTPQKISDGVFLKILKHHISPFRDVTTWPFHESFMALDNIFEIYSHSIWILWIYITYIDKLPLTQIDKLTNMKYWTISRYLQMVQLNLCIYM